MEKEIDFQQQQQTRMAIHVHRESRERMGCAGSGVRTTRLNSSFPICGHMAFLIVAQYAELSHLSRSSVFNLLLRVAFSHGLCDL